MSRTVSVLVQVDGVADDNTDAEVVAVVLDTVAGDLLGGDELTVSAYLAGRHADLLLDRAELRGKVQSLTDDLAATHALLGQRQRATEAFYAEATRIGTERLAQHEATLRLVSQEAVALARLQHYTTGDRVVPTEYVPGVHHDDALADLAEERCTCGGGVGLHVSPCPRANRGARVAKFRPYDDVDGGDPR